jgi:endoglucanase
MIARVVFAVAGAALASAADVTPAIHVDQVGYLPLAPKIAIVAAAAPATTFTVRRAADDRTVFTGNLSDPANDDLSGDSVQAADFSALRGQGEFYLDVPGVGRSYTFTVAGNAFSRAFYLAMRGYYGQRCTTAVDLGPEFPSYRHAACHLTGAYHSSSGKTGAHASVGGWHDAGDYGRYVVNSGISTGTLLWAFEMYRDRLEAIRLNLPESGNGVPDMLNEIRWNLNWMLSMQDGDGGVWQKQTSANFPGFVMPEADTSTSLVIGTGAAPFKSSCATGDFAAVMAIASRVYAAYDATFSLQALQAARSAWNWVAANPNVTFKNPPGISTGEYGDSNCSDERLWAAAELLRTTGDAAYSSYFLANYGAMLSSVSSTNPPAWPSVAALGLWTYALASNADRDASAVAAIRDATVHAADAIAARTAASAYHISMRASDYGWGSNSVAANYGLELLIANALNPDPRYTDAALENLHYLLGRNAFSVSWVTQLGSNAVKDPHHRPSVADTNPLPWPGLLVGGPDPHREDPVMQAAAMEPPMRMWVDNHNAYSVNEIAINWNAPLVFVLAASLPDPPVQEHPKRRR